MIEIKKLFSKLLLLGFLVVSLFSCKTTSLVNYESINYEKFQEGTLPITDLSDEDLYFTRIITATSCTICFFRYSKNNKIQDISINNLKMKDDNGNLIYEKIKIVPKTTGLIHNEKNNYYKIFSFDIEQDELDRQILKKIKTEYIILEFEIDGKQLNDKLKKVEKKYVITRT